MANATTSQPALTVKSASKSTTRGSSRPPSPSTPQVADIMTRTVVTATTDTPLPELIDEMVRYGISGIPVVDTKSRLVRIVTEADLMTKPAYGGTHRRSLAVLGDLLRGRERRWESKATGLTAGEIMTTDVETTRPHEAVQAAARRMVRCGVKRLPVVHNDHLVGIVSRTDVLRSMHRTDEDLQAEIAAVLADPVRVPETTTGRRQRRRRGRHGAWFGALPDRSAGVVGDRLALPGRRRCTRRGDAREPNPQPQHQPSTGDEYLRFMR